MHVYYQVKEAARGHPAQYIRHYTKPGDIVLDRFCGSGGTTLACIRLVGRGREGESSSIGARPQRSQPRIIALPLTPDESGTNGESADSGSSLRLEFKELSGEQIQTVIDWLYETCANVIAAAVEQ